jgi:hypothetical protein
MSLAAMVAAGVRGARAHRRLLGGLFLVELAASLAFVLGTYLALVGTVGGYPLFARAVRGDDAALLSLLSERGPVFSAILALGVGWALGYALLSLYLGAGLLGAFAGRGFAATAGPRYWAFLRLWLLALVPWALALGACAAGIACVDLGGEDLLSRARMVGRPLPGLLPGLLLLAIVSTAVDYGRARLVLSGGGALRALGFGFARVFTRAAALPHVVLYALVWIGVSALYVAGTYGVAFAGAGGALALFALRQLVAGARFAARAATSAGQVAALQVEVLEVGQLVERTEARGDGGEGQAAQPVQGEVLDGE